MTAFIAGCSDYWLFGKPASGGPGATTESSSVDTALSEDDTARRHETGTIIVPDDCPDLAVAPAAAAVSGTCAGFEFGGWDVVVEWEAIVPSSRSRYTPPAAPRTPGGVPILVQYDGSDGLVSYDGRTGAVTVLWAAETVEGPGEWESVYGRKGPAIGHATSDDVLDVAMSAPVYSGDHAVGEGLEVRDVEGAVHGLSDAFTDLHDSVIGWGDFDGDGAVDVFAEAGAASVRGETLLEAPGRYGWVSVPVLTDLGGERQIVNASGIWDQAGSLIPWDDVTAGTPFYGGVVSVGDDLRVLRTDTGKLYGSGPRGETLWQLEFGEHAGAMSVAIGDATGDGVPEMCATLMDTLVLVSAEGELVQTWSRPLGYGTGGCVMADFDADGTYEVVDIGADGLYVYDGRSGATLIGLPEVTAFGVGTPPAVLDVDRDGSGEILALSCDQFDTDDGVCVLRAYGPASGRWARMRPVWNQVGYDITGIDDDGVLIPDPEPAWKHYNAFRAQPAHDGDAVDLTIEETDACATTCGPGGTVRLAVQIANLGSFEASAGSTVRLKTNNGTGWIEASSAVVAEGIGPVMKAEGIVLEIPWEEWGEVRQLEVEGLDTECDWVNNRVRVELDPCDEG